MPSSAQDDAQTAQDTKDKDRNLKAVKADDAAIPVELLSGKVCQALTVSAEDVPDRRHTDKGSGCFVQRSCSILAWKVVHDFWTRWMWDKAKARPRINFG